jgi:starch-binding outer membrane protein, SusD/RagB family
MKSSQIRITVISAIILFSSCSDLDEDLPSEFVSPTSEEEIIALTSSAYIPLSETGAYGDFVSLLMLNELSSDAAVFPVKGGSELFGGQIWQKVHTHTYENTDTALFNIIWNKLFEGINEANKNIKILNEIRAEGNNDLSLIDQFISEMRAMRAMYYFLLLDTFGNVPLVTEYENEAELQSNNPDFNEGRREVFEFIEKELLESIDTISDDVPATYGRMNRFGVHFMLGKLYLNSVVYTGNERFQDAESQFKSISESGDFTLSQDFFTNYSVENENSQENIFVIPFDSENLKNMNMHIGTLHPAQQEEFQLSAHPRGLAVAVPSFYRLFSEDDIRRHGFLTGPRFTPDGDPLTDPEYITDDCGKDESGPEVVLTVDIRELAPCAGKEEGARFAKFEIEIGGGFHASNDFPVFRYADVLLSRAEAFYRLGNSGEALNIVNQVRDRAGLEPLTVLSDENLLAERGRELYLENWRRQDLIRFPGQDGGTTAYNDPWDFKEISELFRNVFPIPQEAIQENPGLNQNPGY